MFRKTTLLKKLITCTFLSNRRLKVGSHVLVKYGNDQLPALIKEVFLMLYFEHSIVILRYLLSVYCHIECQYHRYVHQICIFSSYDKSNISNMTMFHFRFLDFIFLTVMFNLM